MQFAEELHQALGTRPDRQRSKADVGVLYIDLDGFKAINDTFGHDAGDEVLLDSAHRMRSQLRPQDAIARLGGDEFAICAQRIEAEGLAQLALRLEGVLSKPHQIHGKEVVVGGSVGLHIAAAGESADEAIRLADQAMYVAKPPTMAGGPSLQQQIWISTTVMAAFDYWDHGRWSHGQGSRDGLPNWRTY